MKTASSFLISMLRRISTLKVERLRIIRRFNNGNLILKNILHFFTLHRVKPKPVFARVHGIPELKFNRALTYSHSYR